MLEPGQVIGSYRILRKLGEGGMGAVFEASHDEIARRAAIKVLHPQYAQEAQVAQRFLNEAKAVNQIDHPGIVSIYDVGRLPDGASYIVMEFLRGETLSSRIARRGGRLSVAEAIHIARQIASALAAAHQVGIVHRDLKPDNVMIIRDPLQS
ncbi:MAG TPA: serine/threonine-protein kinase, partial [Pseudomonadota bacterium]|nr:serine/threonine-protein kinase [Pseudomonadota bacterium]